TAIAKTAKGDVVSGLSVEWASDNPAVATVLQGYVDGVGVGSAVVTASVGGKQARTSVAVIPTVVASLQLSRTQATLAPGQTLQLIASTLDSKARPIAGRTVSFTSSDTAGADVSSDGLVTARTPSVDTITASV